jgi:hypothetical protein
VAYNNSTDALKQLVLLRLYGGSITRSSGVVSVLTNGIPYFFVEVTCQDGSQYGIPAYGEEAIELHKEVMKMTKREAPLIIQNTSR